MLVTSAAVSLFAAAAICLAVIAYDFARRPLDQDPRRRLRGRVRRGRRLRRPGSIPRSASPAVKFAVDAGIFLVALGSIVIRNPFTLQYALEVVDAETAKLPGFIKRQLHHHLGLDARRCC